VVTVSRRTLGGPDHGSPALLGVLAEQSELVDLADGHLVLLLMCRRVRAESSWLTTVR
jgi:hypothetical protein